MRVLSRAVWTLRLVAGPVVQEVAVDHRFQVQGFAMFYSSSSRFFELVYSTCISGSS